jgi:tetratricopeptide (TPR) repeat protein
VAELSAPPTSIHSGYLLAAVEYRAGHRERAIRAVRQWSSRYLWAGVQAVRADGDRLYPVILGPGDTVRLPAAIGVKTVEAAALMHVDAGLLDLQTLDLGRAGVHFSAAQNLVEWLHAQAAERRRLLEMLRQPKGSDKENPARTETLERALGLELTIDKAPFYSALAAAVLSLGVPKEGLPFAEKALAAAPRDGTILLLNGSVKESLALRDKVAGREAQAQKLRREAEGFFRQALEAEPADAEARLRLGGVLLAQGRPQDAEPVLQEAANRAREDAPQRYLAHLFLGRAAEQQQAPDRGAAFYRVALEIWPESQAARLGLGRCLEASGGSAAARPLVKASLLDSRTEGRAPDPWWSYPFGPRGLANRLAERLWQGTLGRSFGS